MSLPEPGTSAPYLTMILHFLLVDRGGPDVTLLKEEEFWLIGPASQLADFCSVSLEAVRGQGSEAGSWKQEPCWDLDLRTLRRRRLSGVFSAGPNAHSSSSYNSIISP